MRVELKSLVNDEPGLAWAAGRGRIGRISAVNFCAQGVPEWGAEVVIAVRPDADEAAAASIPVFTNGALNPELIPYSLGAGSFSIPMALEFSTLAVAVLATPGAPQVRCSVVIASHAV